jgi:VanZ family protein
VTLYILSGLFVFSALLETAQYFISYRVFNLLDLAANLLGILSFHLCLIIAWFMRRRGMFSKTA